MNLFALLALSAAHAAAPVRVAPAISPAGGSAAAAAVSAARASAGLSSTLSISPSAAVGAAASMSPAAAAASASSAESAPAAASVAAMSEQVKAVVEQAGDISAASASDAKGAGRAVERVVTGEAAVSRPASDGVLPVVAKMGEPSALPAATASAAPAQAAVPAPAAPASKPLSPRALVFPAGFVTAGAALGLLAAESWLVAGAFAAAFLGLYLLGKGVGALVGKIKAENVRREPARYGPGFWGVLGGFSALIHGGFMTLGGIAAAVNGSALLLSIGLPVLALGVMATVPMFTRPNPPSPGGGDMGGMVALMAVMGSFLSALAITMSVGFGAPVGGALQLGGFFGLMGLSFAAMDWLKPDPNASARGRRYGSLFAALAGIGLIGALAFSGGVSVEAVFLIYGVGSAIVILGSNLIPTLVTSIEASIARWRGKAPKTAVPSEPWRLPSFDRKSAVWGGIGVGVAFSLAAFLLSLAGLGAPWMAAFYAFPVLGAAAGLWLSRNAR